jgi:hypothetical protein
MSDSTISQPQLADSSQVLLPLTSSSKDLGLFSVQDETPAQQQQQGTSFARNPIRTQTPPHTQYGKHPIPLQQSDLPQTQYGKQIDLLTLFRQAGSQRTNGIVRPTPPPPPPAQTRLLGEKDILAERVPNAKVSDSSFSQTSPFNFLTLFVARERSNSSEPYFSDT